MPTLDDLITALSGVRTNERNRKRARIVANHLLKSELQEQWHALPGRQKQALMRGSTDRLWDRYMRGRQVLDQSTKEAAEQTIEEERMYLRHLLSSETLTPTSDKQPSCRDRHRTRQS